MSRTEIQSEKSMRLATWVMASFNGALNGQKVQPFDVFDAKNKVVSVKKTTAKKETTRVEKSVPPNG